MKRTFIAVPVKASANLTALSDLLKNKLTGEGLKWVDPQNLHVTLKFLGDTTDLQLQEITGRLEGLCARSVKMEGKMTGLDFFSNQGNPSVLFTTLTGLPQLEALADDVDKALAETGFPAENRPFRPHLTLARIKWIRNKKLFYDLVRSYKSEEIQQVDADRVVLFESILRSQGPLYIPLKTWFLPPGSV